MTAVMALSNERDNASEGSSSLCSFLSAEPDNNSTDAALSLDRKPKGYQKRLAETAMTVIERSRTGDSAGRNLISFNDSSDKFLLGTDVPIFLEGKGSAVDLNGLAALCGPVREQEPHRGFERILFSLSVPGQTMALIPTTDRTMAFIGLRSTSTLDWPLDESLP